MKILLFTGAAPSNNAFNHFLSSRLILIAILESIHVLSISSITVKLDTRCSRLTKVEKWIDIELSVAFMLR